MQKVLYVSDAVYMFIMHFIHTYAFTSLTNTDKYEFGIDIIQFKLLFFFKVLLYCVLFSMHCTMICVACLLAHFYVIVEFTSNL